VIATVGYHPSDSCPEFSLTNHMNLERSRPLFWAMSSCRTDIISFLQPQSSGPLDPQLPSSVIESAEVWQTATAPLTANGAKQRRPAKNSLSSGEAHCWCTPIPAADSARDLCQSKMFQLCTTPLNRICPLLSINTSRCSNITTYRYAQHFFVLVHFTTNLFNIANNHNVFNLGRCSFRLEI
jgi:hypothetical protein